MAHEILTKSKRGAQRVGGDHGGASGLYFWTNFGQISAKLTQAWSNRDFKIGALTPSRSIPSSRRGVAKIPELLILIANKLDIKEQCNLMFVSKCFFDSIGHLVWKRVPRLDVVMRLIKDKNADKRAFWRHKAYYRQWSAILPPDPALSRYEIYSP
ncbi:hypothetical protein B0J17DRAFT_768657 [Rhizoctonia solani]|nr:hypothetical protein B0J17DRAFT_768657 [Rhizoctonia solani]